MQDYYIFPNNQAGELSKWTEEGRYSSNQEWSFKTEGDDQFWQSCEVSGRSIGHRLSSTLFKKNVIERSDFSERINTLYFEIVYEIKSCDELSFASKSCNETLTTSIEINGKGSHVETYVGSSGRNTKFNVFHVTEDLEINNMKLKFSASHSCVHLYKVSMFYYYCPDIAIGLARFPSINAPATFHTAVSGTCAAHSIRKNSFSRFCQSTGNWYETDLDSRCLCEPGYYKLGNECEKCKKNYYKDSVGNHACSRCPAYSYASSRGKLQCPCKSSYKRPPNASPSKPCESMIGSIRSFAYTSFRTFAKLTWKSPSGADDTVKYHITCVECDIPSLVVNKTSVVVNGLLPDSFYKFRITTENSLTDEFKRDGLLPNFFDATVATQKPVRITGVSIRRLNPVSIEVSWSPVDRLYIEFNSYTIQVLRNRNIYQERSTNYTSLVFDGLPDGSYAVSVAVDNEASSRVTSRELYIKGISSRQIELENVTATIGIITLIFIVLLSLFISLICYFRRKKYLYSWQDPNLMELNHDTFRCYNTIPSNTLKMHCGESFIEPAYVYESSEEMYVECTQPLKRKSVVLDDKLPATFGVITCRGILDISGNESAQVNVKVLHEKSNETTKRNFVMEAAILSQLKHPNVILIYGVVFQEFPHMMVMEYVDNGPLNILLKDTCKSSLISPVQLAHILRGVACGMQYLSGEGYTHKVLCSANIMVSASFMCKIAGFEMRAALESELQLEPWKSVISEVLSPWAAPEVIEMYKFSVFSDIWSFGSVIWEVFSEGSRPYFEWKRKEIQRMLDSGYRLPPPDNCPELIYELMMQCWALDPQERPHFHILRESLEAYIRKPVTKTTQNLPDFLQHQINREHNHYSLREWLHSLKLEQYADQLEMLGFCTVEDMLYMDNQALKAFNIMPSKHRKKIISSIELLNKRLVQGNKCASPVHSII